MKPISTGAHKALTFYDWKTDDGKTYTSNLQPGESVVIMGHSNAGGGRMKLAWKHDYPKTAENPNGHSFVSTGLDALEYHLMRAHPDYPHFRRRK